MKSSKKSNSISPADRRAFSNFPREYSPAPLWCWNDDMRGDEIIRQLDAMRKQHVYEAMIFPMAGLIQPYLSPAYFDAYVFTLREARKRGMRIWIYDEYCWPSGTAAGQLLQKYPEYRMRACRFYRYNVSKRDAREAHVNLPPGNVIWAWAEPADNPGKRVPIMDAVSDTALCWRAPAGAWTINLAVVTTVQRSSETSSCARWSPNNSGCLDYMNADAVTAYINMVHESYYRAAPEFFGTTMPGVFTDEPGIFYDTRIIAGRDELQIGYRCRCGENDVKPFKNNPALHGFFHSVPWTHDFLNQFKKNAGYDLRPCLPELIRKTDGDRKVCYDYFRLISDLFTENYADRIGKWCARRKVVFSGHWCEGLGFGDFYHKARAQQIPGIDMLGAHTVFDKLIERPRQIASVARMNGRTRVLAETYGVTPWGFEMAHKIRDADMLTVLGINLHSSIDFAYSFRGVRKHTNNPPGLLQSPAWCYQRFLSDHIARLCMATSLGRSTVDAAIMYPSAADIANSMRDSAANTRLEKNMRRAFTGLMSSQIEADFLFESGLAQARIKAGSMVFPGAEYRTVILAGVNILAVTTFEILVKFVESGGRLIIAGSMPVSGPRNERPPDAWRTMLRGGTFRCAKTDERSARKFALTFRYGAGQVVLRDDKAVAAAHEYCEENKNDSVRRNKAVALIQDFWLALFNDNGTMPLAFMKGRRLCDCLTFAVRMADQDIIISVMNRSGRELHLDALRKDNTAGAIELWDLDSGAIRPVINENAGFKCDFAPYECRVFVLTQRRKLSASDISTDAPSLMLTRPRKVIGESCGPWPFRPERQNAYPLLAGAVSYADVAHPDKQIHTLNGAIPAEFRTVPIMLFESIFEIEQVADRKMELLYEEGLMMDIRINGQPVDDSARRNRYLDVFGMSVPVGGLLRKGRNRITALYMPEVYERKMRGRFYHEDVMQPTPDVFLLGDFAVVKNRLTAPVRCLDARPWRDQGYPYYTGTGEYTVKWKIPDVRGDIPIWAEIKAREGIVEVCDFGGNLIGTRLQPPYLFNVTCCRRRGEIKLKIKVTHTLGALLTHQRAAALKMESFSQGVKERLREYDCGLETARLVGE